MRRGLFDASADRERAALREAQLQTPAGQAWRAERGNYFARRRVALAVPVGVLRLGAFLASWAIAVGLVALIWRLV